MTTREITIIQSKINKHTMKRMQEDFPQTFGYILWVEEEGKDTQFYIEVTGDPSRPLLDAIVLEMKGWLRGYLSALQG